MPSDARQRGTGWLSRSARFETERLILRTLIADDLDGWAAFSNDPATAATMDWAIDTLGWTDIIHTIDPDNAASIALARRIGSTDRGPGRLPAPHQDRAIVMFGQTADRWCARRGGYRLALARQRGDAPRAAASIRACRR